MQTKSPWPLIIVLVLTLLTVGCSSQTQKQGKSLRVASFNALLTFENEGELAEQLASPSPESLDRFTKVAEIIQRVRPDVLLINEFDYDAENFSAKRFLADYLNVGQNDQDAIDYPYLYAPPSNTGVPILNDQGEPIDTNQNGRIDPGDYHGWGEFPGRYAMLVLSKYPIDHDNIRTFQNLTWASFPQSKIPQNHYHPDAHDRIRLSSKNHADVPVIVNGKPIHLLISHPTPPVFDGPEDRNGKRQYDEMGIWRTYISTSTSAPLRDDENRPAKLGNNLPFIIMGDLNADPNDGESMPGAVQQLTEHWRVNATVTPASEGAVEAAEKQGDSNLTHRSPPKYDTADFSEGSRGPGNLRVDYVLPSNQFDILDAGVFWPKQGQPGYDLIDASDHRLVWVDLRLID